MQVRHLPVKALKALRASRPQNGARHEHAHTTQTRQARSRMIGIPGQVTRIPALHPQMLVAAGASKAEGAGCIAS